MTNRAEMIVVRNWDRFQHYKKRNPPWIRLYRDLIDRPEYRRLSDAAARLLVEIWLLASEFDPGGHLPLDLNLLAWRTGRASTDASIATSLQELESQGFIELPENASANASTIASKRGPQRQSTETESSSKEDSSETVPVSSMWSMWLERFGGGGRQPTLTSNRRKALQTLYREQLAEAENPLDVFGKVLERVRGSEWHMSKRQYQYPESLFRNEDRRDHWVSEAMSRGNGTNEPGALRRPRL